jgi:hypothetical protein
MPLTVTVHLKPSAHLPKRSGATNVHVKRQQQQGRRKRRSHPQAKRGIHFLRKRVKLRCRHPSSASGRSSSSRRRRRRRVRRRRRTGRCPLLQVNS